MTTDLNGQCEPEETALTEPDLPSETEGSRFQNWFNGLSLWIRVLAVIAIVVLFFFLLWLQAKVGGPECSSGEC